MTEFREPELHEVKLITDAGNFLVTVLPTGQVRAWRVNRDDTVTVPDRYSEEGQPTPSGGRIGIPILARPRLLRLTELFGALNTYWDDGFEAGLRNFEG